jgi:hypothetical protein
VGRPHILNRVELSDIERANFSSPQPETLEEEE